MAFGGDGRGNVLDALLEKLGVDPEELEDLPEGEIPVAPRGPRRVPLSGLGDDWFVPVISLVRKGQVPKAKVIALKSATEEEGMAASNVSNERLLVAVIRAALDRPEGDDLAVLEGKLEALEPTAGQQPKAALKSRQGVRPDRDHLGRRIDKPHGLQSMGRY